MKEIIKKVSFALCPGCFWLATYYKRARRVCPNCNSRVSIQTVKVLATMQNEDAQKETFIPEVQYYGSMRRLKGT